MSSPPPTISAFEASPDRGRGLARDMRVRWALEEVGQPYAVRLQSFAALKEPAHRARNPFGQIPTYEDGDLVLFESGAIVFHIAESHAGLLPQDTNARARAVMWMFAALNTVEPPIFDLSLVRIIDRDQPWLDHRIAALEKSVRVRIADLSAHLDDSEYLDGDFSAADILMATVLLRLRAAAPHVLNDFPNVAAYLARNEARPTYQRAFAAQRQVFEDSQKKPG